MWFEIGYQHKRQLTFQVTREEAILTARSMWGGCDWVQPKGGLKIKLAPSGPTIQ